MPVLGESGAGTAQGPLPVAGLGFLDPWTLLNVGDGRGRLFNPLASPAFPLITAWRTGLLESGNPVIKIDFRRENLTTDH